MTFTQPTWLFLIPVVLPLILLLHAKRMRDVVVPSVVVWRRVETTSAPVPSQRSYPWRDPLLWLQLLAAAMLVLALARPAFGGSGTRWVVLLDASLTMSATDVEPSRFDAAMRSVVERWGSRGASGTVSLVSVGPRARLVAADWPAGPEFRHTLKGLGAGAGQADWFGAAARAARLAASGDVRLAVVSDSFGAPAALAALESLGFRRDDVDVISVGADLVNVGIDEVEAEPRSTHPHQWTVSGRVATAGFVQGDVVRVVASFRPLASSIFLPWGAEEVVVASDGTGLFAIPLDLPGPGEVQVAGPQGDHLRADDAAVVSLQSVPVRVAIAGDIHPALRRALASIENLEAFTIESAPLQEESAYFDLVIVTDGAGSIPGTSTLWLGAPPVGVADGIPIRVPTGSLATAPHPLTADLDTSAFSIASAVPLVALAGASPLLVSGDTVLAWARTTTTGRQVVIGFDLGDTDWVSQVSFPAFVAALVDWAAPREWSHSPGGCRVGEACEWPRETFAGGWELLDPAGRPVRGVPTPEEVADDPLADAVWTGPRLDAGFWPSTAGTYTLVTQRGPVHLPVVATPLSGGPVNAKPEAGVRPGAIPVALWRWLAVVAGAVLAFEALLGLYRKPRVVRRRAPLTLTGLALVTLILAVIGAPVPVFGTDSTVVWVGWDDPATSVAGVEGWEWVQRRTTSVQDDSTEARGAADLSAALELALARPRNGGGLRVVVPVSGDDGLPVTEAGDLVYGAEADGVRIDIVAAGGQVVTVVEGSEAPSLGAVALPERVRAGSHFAMAVDVAVPDGAAWRLRATPVSAASERYDSELVPPPFGEVSGIGDGRAEIELRAGGQGEVVYRLTLHLEGREESSTEASVSVPVGPPPAVLLIAADDARGAGLESALETQGLTVDRTTPFRMPGTMERLVVYDVILLVDIAASDVFPEYQVLLERYVREHGGGLAIVGGTSAFGPGGYYSTPLEDVSPLSSRITDEAPEVAIAFLLDRSGSMSGAVNTSNRMDVAKAATLEAVGLLGDRSLAAIVVFDTEARVVLPLTPVSDEGAFRTALTTVAPAGGTSLYPGLVAAYQLMAASPAATRHVVVLTDGLSQDGDFAGVLKLLAEAGVSTTFVGVGDAADRRQLTMLAGLSGGTLHMALDFRALPSLLAQEALMLAATPIEEGAVTARWSEGRPPDFLGDVSETDLPRLDGYVRTTLKDEALLHAYVGGDDPLLASWRYGLGRVVAFASDADARWSRAWTESESFPRTWAQLIRWTGDRPVRDPWALRLGRRDNVLDIVVDIPARAERASMTALPFASITNAGGGVLARSRLERIGNTRAAVSFEVDAGRAGELTVSLSAAPELGLKEAVTRSIAWPLPPGPFLRTDIVPVYVLAEGTGGEVYASASDVDVGLVGRVLRWRLMPEAWLLLALVALLASLAVRFGVVPRVPASLRVWMAARTRTALRDR